MYGNEVAINYDFHLHNNYNLLYICSNEPERKGIVNKENKTDEILVRI
jgi:hypothetical protein